MHHSTTNEANLERSRPSLERHQISLRCLDCTDKTEMDTQTVCVTRQKLGRSGWKVFLFLLFSEEQWQRQSQMTAESTASMACHCAHTKRTSKTGTGAPYLKLSAINWSRSVWASKWLIRRWATGAQDRLLLVRRSFAQNILILFAEEHLNFQLKLDILDGALSPEQGCDASLISFPCASDSQTRSAHHIFAEGKSTKKINICHGRCGFNLSLLPSAG